jgi:hypothetical protein
VLSVEAHEDDLREIARRGYEDVATTDRKGQAEAVSLFFAPAPSAPWIAWSSFQNAGEDVTTRSALFMV